MLTYSGGKTARAAAADRKRLLADMEKDRRAKLRKRLAELRAKELAERKAKKRKLRRAGRLCKKDVERTREKANAAWERERQAALGKRRARKKAARQRCRDRAARARTRSDIQIASARETRKSERKHAAEIRRLERSGAARSRARSTRSERRSESDDEVEQNIAPELVRLWRRVKRTIKGSERMSRTEAFLKYVEENPEERYALSEDADWASEQADYYRRK